MRRLGTVGILKASELSLLASFSSDLAALLVSELYLGLG